MEGTILVKGKEADLLKVCSCLGGGYSNSRTLDKLIENNINFNSDDRERFPDNHIFEGAYLNRESDMLYIDVETENDCYDIIESFVKAGSCYFEGDYNPKFVSLEDLSERLDIEAELRIFDSANYTIRNIIIKDGKVLKDNIYNAMMSNGQTLVDYINYR